MQRLGLIRTLVPLLDELISDEEELATSRALGLALLGEALAVLEDPRGRRCSTAAALSETLPARDHVLAFVAQSHAARDPRERGNWRRRSMSRSAVRNAPGAPPAAGPTQSGASPRSSRRRGRTSRSSTKRGGRRFARLAAASPGKRRWKRRACSTRPRSTRSRATRRALRALQMAGIAASAVARDPQWGDSFEERGAGGAVGAGAGAARGGVDRRRLPAGPR